ncbi:MAG: hypothetical protein AAF533_02225 [Acidobacteriota bacterium]
MALSLLVGGCVLQDATYSGWWHLHSVTLEELRLVEEERGGRTHLVVLGYLRATGDVSIRDAFLDLRVVDAEGRFIDSLGGEVQTTIPAGERISFRLEGPAMRAIDGPLRLEGRVHHAHRHPGGV